MTLDVDSGETYTITSGDEQTFGPVNVDGELNINGVLNVESEPPQGRGENVLFDEFVRAADVESGDLYIQYVSLSDVTTAFAVVVGGLMLFFGWMAARLRSPLMGTLWLFMILAFVFALLFNTPLEWFWVAVMLTAIGAVAALVNVGGR